MKRLSICFLILLVAFSATANNVVTSAVSLTGQNTTTHATQIKFSITWNNSWRSSTNEANYDGCWIFAKFRKKNAYLWQHATINYVAPGTAAASGHIEPAGSTIKTASDGKGAFIYRNADGSGTVTFNAAQLRWNYGIDGVADNDSVEMKVFAVEMVYVPTGSFYLGSNGNESGHFRKGNVDATFQVTSENAITIGTTAANLNAEPANASLDAGNIPAAYPKGYNNFWCMKYEVSERQYVDFLNNIDVAYATARNPYFTGTHPNLTTTAPERACTQLGGTDMLSLLDWSGLRPMSEMEYEKACRGVGMLPVANEYAWGTAGYVDIATPTAQGTASETWAIGNVNYNSGAGLMRCGALATASSTRYSSGGTFYGIMEMSGNAAELVVNATAVGRVFTGLHGDGSLGSTGAYNVANWPVVGYGGDGYRGGGYSAWYINVSDRSAVTSGMDSRTIYQGGRGVRTAE